jgi:hypothetical protein
VVGTLSADGSRRWDGKYWVRLTPDRSLSELPLPTVRLAPGDVWSERRGFGLGGALLAAIVGVVLSSINFTLPWSGSAESAFFAMVVTKQLWALFTYGSMVVILSIGRRGADVLLLRAMLVAFLMGAAFLVVFVTTPLPFAIPVPGLLVVLLGGLLAAVTGGPFLAAMAMLANLLWYRSFESLQPQLGIFNRAS